MTDRPDHEDAHSGKGPDFSWEEFHRTSGAAPKENRFHPCYRHPQTSTGITCQRCGRYICGACMVPASVGFLCPECSGGGQQRQERSARRPRSGRTARLNTGLMSGAAFYLALITAIIGVLNLILSNVPAGLLMYHPQAVAAGQVWRLLTSGVVVVGIFNIILTPIFIIFLGRQVEQVLGTKRFLATWAISVLGAALTMSVVPIGAAPTAFSALLGLMAAMMVLKYRTGQDIRSDLIFFAIILAMNLFLGGMLFVAHVGALIGGILAGLVLAYVKTERRQWWSLAGIGVGLAVVSFGLSALSLTL